MKCLITVLCLMLAFQSHLHAQQKQKHHPHKAKHVIGRSPTPIIFEFDPFPIPLDSVSRHIFDEVIVTSPVSGLRQTPKEVYLFLGADSPNQRLIVILDSPETRRLAKGLKGKTVTVTGKLFTDNDRDDGKPVMYVSFQDFIKIHK